MGFSQSIIIDYKEVIVFECIDYKEVMYLSVLITKKWLYLKCIDYKEVIVFECIDYKEVIVFESIEYKEVIVFECILQLHFEDRGGGGGGVYLSVEFVFIPYNWIPQVQITKTCKIYKKIGQNWTKNIKMVDIISRMCHNCASILFTFS